MARKNVPDRLVCKPGDRARILDGTMNKGRIVVVVRRYIPGEKVGGHDDWMEDDPFTWVTVPIGLGLRCVMVRQGKTVCEFPRVMEMPIADHRLMPLHDDDDGLKVERSKAVPIRAARKGRKAVPHV